MNDIKYRRSTKMIFVLLLDTLKDHFIKRLPELCPAITQNTRAYYIDVILAGIVDLFRKSSTENCQYDYLTIWNNQKVTWLVLGSALRLTLNGQGIHEDGVYRTKRLLISQSKHRLISSTLYCGKNWRWRVTSRANYTCKMKIDAPWQADYDPSKNGARDLIVLAHFESHTALFQPRVFTHYYHKSSTTPFIAHFNYNCQRSHVYTLCTQFCWNLISLLSSSLS